MYLLLAVFATREDLPLFRILFLSILSHYRPFDWVYRFLFNYISASFFAVHYSLVVSHSPCCVIGLRSPVDDFSVPRRIDGVNRRLP